MMCDILQTLCRSTSTMTLKLLLLMMMTVPAHTSLSSSAPQRVGLPWSPSHLCCCCVAAYVAVLILILLFMVLFLSMVPILFTKRILETKIYSLVAVYAQFPSCIQTTTCIIHSLTVLLTYLLSWLSNYPRDIICNVHSATES